MEEGRRLGGEGKVGLVAGAVNEVLLDALAGRTKLVRHVAFVFFLSPKKKKKKKRREPEVEATKVASSRGGTREGSKEDGDAKDDTEDCRGGGHRTTQHTAREKK
jgi:hypothetical protein